MKKVITILVDGMRPDAIDACKSEEAEWILKNSSYTLNAKTVFPSVTLPCHMSLFHSVDPIRHGVTTNVFTPQVRPILGLCEQLNSNGKTVAFYYTWGELKDLYRPESVTYSDFAAGHTIGFKTATDRILPEAIKCLQNEQPDFMFFYIGETDDEGHRVGWMSDGYLENISRAFKIIKQIIDSLPPDYITIVLADHGGHDRNHGSAENEDMTIPLIIHGLDKNVNFDNATILDVAPTVTKILEVPANGDWEGTSLV